jgi:hypothetical protein
MIVILAPGKSGNGFAAIRDYFGECEALFTRELGETPERVLEKAMDAPELVNSHCPVKRIVAIEITQTGEEEYLSDLVKMINPWSPNRLGS